MSSMRLSAKLYYFGPVLLWMAVIFVMSSRAGSTEHSASLVEVLIQRISPTFRQTLSPYQIDCLDYGFRKTCHVTEYAILALLLLRGLTRGRGRASLGIAAAALAISALYAASDEFHQRFVPLRTPSVEDVLIDTSGASGALILVLGASYLAAADRRTGRRLLGLSPHQERAAESMIEDSVTVPVAERRR
jgi:VanZ family protein